MQVLTKQTLKTFWSHAKKYRWQVWVILAGIVILEIGQVSIPLLYRELINLLTGDAAREKFSMAFTLVVFIFVLNFLKNGIWRAVVFVNNYFQARVMRDLTNTCYEYLQKHSFGFFTSRFVGSLVTRVKRYERAFETIADQITFDLGRSLLDATLIMTLLLAQYTTIGLIVLGWAVLFILFSYFFARFKLPYDIARARADTNTTAQLADSITNNANIKLFSGYGRENQRFSHATNRQFRARRKSWDLATIGDIVQSISMMALEFGVIYFAVKYWYQGRIGVGDVALLQIYILRMSDKLWNTGKNIRNLYEAVADANEMTEMLQAPHEVTDVSRAGKLKVKQGKIEFNDVSFGYHREAAILEHFSLTIAPGERVALIGPSGGGKSTIIKLLLRFYDINGGNILIDGQNIAGVTQDSLRDALSLVPQEPILFHRSLAENIRYAKPEASDTEVIRAAKLAHAHEFISSFRDGYETLVGERGIKLSGGERQRVAIARAILKDAPILLLDEATSSLDSESEQFIQDALTKLMHGRTTIVIAHRLSTIMQMDRIVVIENGKIVEEGKHEELIKVQQGLYQRLWDIQAGGFAAAPGA